MSSVFKYYLNNYLHGGIILGPVVFGFAVIGKFCSENPKFRSSNYNNTYITNVWVSLKKIKFPSGANYGLWYSD